MSKKPTIAFTFCRPTAQLPSYMHEGDAGMDVYAAEDVLLKAGESKVVPVGLKVAIPLGYEIQVRPRSGLSLKTRIRMPNSIGTIDAGYRDELGILLYNCSVKNDPDFASEILTVNEKENRPGNYQIKKGDRIAQFVVAEVCQAQWEEVEDVQILGSNRGGGFGHSGTR